MSAQPAVRVLVCGTVDRGDDGAAVRAIDAVLPRLAPTLRASVDVRHCVQLDPSDVSDVEAGVSCLVLDTVVGVAPGSVVEIPLDELSRLTTLAARSSHALPIQHVLGIADGVRGGLPAGLFVGIGGERFGFGDQLSPAVRRGGRAFERATARAIAGLAAAPRPDPGPTVEVDHCRMDGPWGVDRQAFDDPRPSLRRRGRPTIEPCGRN